MNDLLKTKIGIIGLGYVGLPVAIAFAEKFDVTVGFDLSKKRIETLRSGFDKNGDLENQKIKDSTIKFSDSESDLKNLDFYVVAVPTPIDGDRKPDLSPLKFASELLGRVISKNATIVFESTVYPGVTEEFCGPIIEAISGLKQNQDFKLGYSPERINPGDKIHTLEKIVKVVSGEDESTLDLVFNIYSQIISAGVYKASSIKVAEAAKVIENTQRDLNIALMNELSLIFDRMNISTKDVIAAASTKWNFLPFMPGLVGGHCIGVDPYYLTSKAEKLGYQPRVILAGRAINDSMGIHIANKLLKLLIESGSQVSDAKVGILGITFKENVSDLRNSRIPDIIQELKEFHIMPIIHDPYVSVEDAKHEYDIELSTMDKLENLDAVVIAVSHQEYLDLGIEKITSMLKEKRGVLVDVKGIYEKSNLPSTVKYWSL